MSNVSLLSNRYRIEKQLGSGGMAIVYHASDLLLERQVAIKVLRETYSSDPAFRERFRQEAKAAANLIHPSIVTVYDFGYDAERLYIVMEYVPGLDFKSLLKRTKIMSVEAALPLIIQACAGLGFAHRAGLVHCDVKPQNMLVTPDQRLKVADFGIARAFASISPDEKANIVWGSPQYYSPEQSAGQPPSPASDVYSLGVIMYEMFTGRLPFLGNKAEELARQHQNDAPPPLRQINPNLPEALEEIILKVLSKEPAARYRSADQLGRVLMGFKATAADDQDRPSAAPTAWLPTRQIKPAPQAAPAPYRPVPTSSQGFTPGQPAVVKDNPFDIDWITWALGLLAFITAGGLIPFCLWVYLTFFPPGG